LLGDACLKQVAKLLTSQTIHPNDFTARYGGEEFAIILPDTDSDGACKVAKNIIKALAQLKIPHSASPTCNSVTISMGICTVVPASHLSPDTLINNADQALYKVKHSGRNGYYTKIESMQNMNFKFS